MAWVDPQTGRRYNDAEVATMEQSAEPSQGAPSSALPPVTDPAVAIGRALSPDHLKEMAGGVANSLKRPYLGLKQIGAYALGTDENRAAVNKEIQDLEAEQAASGPAGAVGDFIGNAAQFAVPGTVASKVAKVLPQGAKIVQGVTGGAGSVRRGALDSAAFEAAQPVNPGDLSNEEFLLNKGVNLAKGAATAVPSAAGARVLTREDPWLRVDPERKALANEAERLGLPLTPAQKTGDRTLQQYEEGLAAKPGSGKLIADIRAKQQAALNEKAAQALGVNAAVPNEAALQMARENAAKLYEPIASIPKLRSDVPLFDSLDKFIAQQRVRPITGSTNAADLAIRLKQTMHKMNGEVFLEELQGVRDLAYKAAKDGDVATSKQLRALGGIMENFLERRVAEMTGRGEIAPDALRQLIQGRTEYAKLHAIEKAVDPVTGHVSAPKYLNQEFKRKPASAGRTSALDQGLADVGATARVLRQTQPYIGSSGTAERQAGQQMVDMSTGPLAALKGSVPLAKNYLAAKYYLTYGDQPGFLAKHLSPERNMMVRRMIPQDILAAEEAAQR